MTCALPSLKVLSLFFVLLDWVRDARYPMYCTNVGCSVDIVVCPLRHPVPGKRTHSGGRSNLKETSITFCITDASTNRMMDWCMDRNLITSTNQISTLATLHETRDCSPMYNPCTNIVRSGSSDRQSSRSYSKRYVPWVSWGAEHAKNERTRRSIESAFIRSTKRNIST